MSPALSERLALEEDWIGLCRAGDMAVWRTLYDQHLPLVYRVARRMGVPERDLGDVCQEVFLRVYRGLGSFRGEAQFSHLALPHHDERGGPHGRAQACGARWGRCWPAGGAGPRAAAAR